MGGYERVGACAQVLRRRVWTGPRVCRLEARCRALVHAKESGGTLPCAHARQSSLPCVEPLPCTLARQ